jgi:hypothetical protein
MEDAQGRPGPSRRQDESVEGHLIEAPSDDALLI